jgi:hypothetical protein
MSIAPLRLRVVAAAIDAVVVLASFIGFTGAVVMTAVGLTRILGARHQAVPRSDPSLDGEQHAEADLVTAEANANQRARLTPEPSTAARSSNSFRRFGLQPSTLPRLIAGAGPGLAVAVRNYASPGYRLMGLRRVDARTGGPVRASAPVIGSCFDQLSQAVVKSLFGTRIDARQTRVRALQPQIDVLRSRYSHDPDALQEAMTEFYAQNRLNLWSGCGQLLAGHLIWNVGVFLGSREGRTVRDRLTGTAVIIAPNPPKAATAA